MIEEYFAPFAPYVVYIMAAVAFFLSLALTPLMRRLAIKLKITDKPDGDRKLQEEAVPYLGGVAVIISFLVSSAILWFLQSGVPKVYLMVVIGSILMGIFGLIDDIKDLKPIIKFVGQIALSIATVLVCGGIEYINLFGFYIHLGFLSIPVTVLWITLVTNSVNMIDGLDGLASGISVFSLIAMIVASFILNDVVCLVISVTLCMACLGFLPFNFPPAKIYLGDSGALALGYIIGCLSVYGLFKGTTFLSVLVPMLLVGLPVSDTMELFFFRLFKGRSPFSADRQHVHFKLVDRGVSTRRSTLILYALSAAFSVSSIVYIWSKAFAIVIAAIALGVFILIKFLPAEKK